MAGQESGLSATLSLFRQRSWGGKQVNQGVQPWKLKVTKKYRPQPGSSAEDRCHAGSRTRDEKYARAHGKIAEGAIDFYGLHSVLVLMADATVGSSTATLNIALRYKCKQAVGRRQTTRLRCLKLLGCTVDQ